MDAYFNFFIDFQFYIQYIVWEYTLIFKLLEIIIFLPLTTILLFTIENL
jgi:hypothetical protein